VSVGAKPGDRQAGIDRQRPAEFGASLVEPAEMSIGGDLDPHRCDQARLVVQGAVGPFDRLFETSRREMSESDNIDAEKGIQIERLKRRARSMASIAFSGWLRDMWIWPLASQA